MKNASSKKKSATKKTAATAASIMPVADITHQQNIPLLPTQLMEDTIESIQNLMEDFKDVANNNLTPLQRRRKIGAGIRNYGFIDKASDLAAANPRYAQFFKVADLKNCIRNIESCRELIILLQSFARIVTNMMMIYSDDAEFDN